MAVAVETVAVVAAPLVDAVATAIVPLVEVVSEEVVGFEPEQPVLALPSVAVLWPGCG